MKNLFEWIIVAVIIVAAYVLWRNQKTISDAINKYIANNNSSTTVGINSVNGAALPVNNLTSNVLSPIYNSSVRVPYITSLYATSYLIPSAQDQANIIAKKICEIRNNKNRLYNIYSGTVNGPLSDLSLSDISSITGVQTSDLKNNVSSTWIMNVINDYTTAENTFLGLLSQGGYYLDQARCIAIPYFTPVYTYPVLYRLPFGFFHGGGHHGGGGHGGGMEGGGGTGDGGMGGGGMM